MTYLSVLDPVYSCCLLMTNWYQIYINTADQVRQDAMGFAPLGKVVQGMGVIDSLYSGYGETSGGGMRAGHQGKLFEEGNPFLDRSFPNLDKLFDCEVLPS
jgi:peptidyl-prolyl cis-trans isomerase A (cyclophilin A)